MESGWKRQKDTERLRERKPALFPEVLHHPTSFPRKSVLLFLRTQVL